MAVSCVDPTELSEQRVFDPSKQQTLKESITISGVGLFTAEKVTLSIHPADPESGVIFQRMDLPGKPKLVANLSNVVSTPRCTILGNQHFTIHTVEHVLAALSAMGIDNALIQLNGPEVPIDDGSANVFVEAILAAGIQDQEKKKSIVVLQSPVSWSKAGVHLIAIPSENFQVSYTLHFPQSKILGSQYFTTAVTPQDFYKKVAAARTFCLYEEITPFIESGLIKGGGLENAVIIKNDRIINPDGVRFPDEMVRHKILDLIGDLSLIAPYFCAHVIAICSGHASNIAFGRKLQNYIKMERA